jgi:hypothetical protein
MIDEALAHDVAEALRLAGLPARTFDGSNAGGFGTETGAGLVRVFWSSSDELLHRVDQAVQRGDITAPVIRQLGTVKGVMTEAMVDILRAAGLTARMSEDENWSGSVEVLGREG